MTRSDRVSVFEEGRSDFSRGLSKDANPYVTPWGVDHELAFEWSLGWTAAYESSQREAAQ